MANTTTTEKSGFNEKEQNFLKVVAKVDTMSAESDDPDAEPVTTAKSKSGKSKLDEDKQRQEVETFIKRDLENAGKSTTKEKAAATLKERAKKLQALLDKPDVATAYSQVRKLRQDAVGKLDEVGAKFDEADAKYQKDLKAAAEKRLEAQKLSESVKHLGNAKQANLVKEREEKLAQAKKLNEEAEKLDRVAAKSKETLDSVAGEVEKCDKRWQEYRKLKKKLDEGIPKLLDDDGFDAQAVEAFELRLEDIVEMYDEGMLVRAAQQLEALDKEFAEYAVHKLERERKLVDLERRLPPIERTMKELTSSPHLPKEKEGEYQKRHGVIDKLFTEKDLVKLEAEIKALDGAVDQWEAIIDRIEEDLETIAELLAEHEETMSIFPEGYKDQYTDKAWEALKLATKRRDQKNYDGAIELLEEKAGQLCAKAVEEWEKFQTVKKKERVRRPPRTAAQSLQAGVEWLEREVLAAFGRNFQYAGPSVSIPDEYGVDNVAPHRLKGALRRRLNAKKPSSVISGKGIPTGMVFEVAGGPGKRYNFNVKVKYDGEPAIAQIHVVY